MATTNQNVTIVTFGDSITQAAEQEIQNRWPERLRLALQQRFSPVQINLINAGVGGNTSREGLARLEKDVLQHRPQFVTVEFGNDLTDEPDRHVDLEEFVANLEQIRSRVEKHCQGRLILLTFTPIVDAWHAHAPRYVHLGGIDAVEETYRQQSRRWAKDCNLTLIDTDRILRKKMALNGPAECILPDGVHLTARGNQLLGEAVLKVLAPQIAEFLGR